MKSKLKLNFITCFIIGIFFTLALLVGGKPVLADDVQGYENYPATDGTNQNNGMQCNRSGAAKDCYFNVSTSNPNLYQAYRGWAKTYVTENFGSNANVIIQACLTTVGWGDGSNGPCKFLYSGNPITPGGFAYYENGVMVIVDEAYESLNLLSFNQADMALYKYVSYHIYVSNIYTSSNLHAQGRRVHVNYFTANGGTDISITQGQSVDLAWQTTDAYVSVVIQGPEGPLDTGGQPSGEISDGPLTDAIYTIIAQGPGTNHNPGGPAYQYAPGMVMQTVRVTVLPPSGSPPGVFYVHSASCFNWPSPEVEVNLTSSAGATSYTLQRNTSGGGWQNVFSNVSFDYIDSHTDYVNQNTDYEYRAIAHNEWGNTTTSNSDTVFSSQANCSDGPPPAEICGNGIDDDGDGLIDEGCVVGSCTDNSSVSIIQAVPATVTAGQTYPFTVRVTNTGDTRWYHGTAYWFQQSTGQSIISTAPGNVAGLNYGHLPYGVNPSDYVDWTFNLTAPATEGAQSVAMRMMHRAGWDYTLDAGGSCDGPGSDTAFGAQMNMNFTVQPVVPSILSFVITYTPITLLPPTSPTISNTTCSQLNLTWSYTSNGAEDGFNIYRSTDNTTWGSPINGSLVSAAARSYSDTPPLTGVTYYYRIATHRAANIEPREAWTASSVDAQNIGCVGNLNNSTMTLTHVNGAAFSGATIIKKDDVLRYRILIINQGPASVQVQRICGNPGSSLVNPSNFSASGVGLNNGGMQTGNAECISLGNQGLRFSITGTKNVANNWIIDYDTVYSPSVDNPQEVLSNSAKIYYSDATAKIKTVTAPTILVNTSTPAPPTFREVAP